MLLVTACMVLPPGAAAAQATRAAGAVAARTVAIPAGAYRPLYGADTARVRVPAFRLDRRAVTRGEFLDFVRADSAWRRGRVRPVFAEAGYLAGWPGPLDAGGPADLLRPVTAVSWFAARAYCASRGERLPTTDEWEYAAQASETVRDASRDRAFRDRLIALYAAPAGERTRPGRGFRNVFGVEGMHGGPWEWTEDFNSVLVSADSREAGGTSRHTDFRAVCAYAAIGASDPTDYPAFLRYAVRAALDARTTIDRDGFRCAAHA
ncbi:MAG TPA: formylglycine-generating enzyme family protein [Gemmatimonadaceae bacterium]|nr:formylglycine-generating enzyme family protein [Gemmatimonadaceae bacterium]